MTISDIAPSPLAYNGMLINTRDEMLSLTDMWKAAKAAASQAPAKWRELPSAKAFVEALEVTVGKSDSDLFVTINGGRAPGTWAHWQIGLAYAKYLSPEFHMWCNTVVRERMEGIHASRDLALDPNAMKAIGGMVKGIIHRELSTVLPTMVEAAIVADPRRAVMDVVSVRQLLDGAKAIQKGRNGLNRRVGFELRERALTRQPPITLRRCPNSMVWLFPRAFAESYMLERGLRLVREHNDRARGQGVLTLVGKAS